MKHFVHRRLATEGHQTSASGGQSVGSLTDLMAQAHQSNRFDRRDRAARRTMHDSRRRALHAH
ncbi:hypothetical protein MIC448_1640008 [Microbacterium sp. C448]|nr:hypothetical protein MIC448_1640008 [Microbacterium sp. C448]